METQTQKSAKQILIAALSANQTAMVAIKKTLNGNDYAVQLVTRVAKSNGVNVLKMLNPTDDRIKDYGFLAYTWTKVEPAQLQLLGLSGEGVTVDGKELAIANPTLNGSPLYVRVTDVLFSDYKGDKTKLTDNDYIINPTTKVRSKSNGQDVIRRKTLGLGVVEHSFIQLDNNNASALKIESVVTGFVEEGAM
jgi:gentisate 1,2-dioxygenase